MSSNQDFVRMLLREDLVVPFVIAGAIVAVITVRSIASCIKTSSRERTRREIAAFIAEGSITPEQGERLMKAGGTDS